MRLKSGRASSYFANYERGQRMMSMGKALVSALVALTISTPVMAEEVKSSGTGFAVTSDGWLITNAHVIEGCERIEVKGNGLVGDTKVDAANDLALIKIAPNTRIEPLTFRRAPIRLGEDIMTVGFPLAGLLSDSIKTTTGNVNALAGLGNDTRYIQISTPIQPGNSGGPVVDYDGFLLGITSATLSKKAADAIGITAQNVNFAIRAPVAEMFMQSQGIANHSGDRSTDQKKLDTADLAEKVVPSAYQVLCYGPAESQFQASKNQPEEAVVSYPPMATNHELKDAYGYDAIGFDYATLKNVQYSDCRSACEGDTQCKAITYNTKHRFCFLKDDVVALIRNSDAVAAYSTSKAADVIISAFTSYSGMDIPGGDYQRIQKTNYLGCFVACIGDNACKAFSYVSKKRECWLKDGLERPRAAQGVELGIK